VKAFQPTDVYPCTVDEKNWVSETSVEHLFGRFCSGTILAHDRKMEMLTSPQLIPRSKAGGDNGTESREGSAESLSHYEDTVSEDLVQSCSDTTPYFRIPSEQYQLAKRQRLYPALASKYPGSVDISRERLHKIKKSFQEHLRRKQGKTDASARLEVEGVIHLPGRRRPLGRGKRNEPNLTYGMRTELTKLSDTSPSISDDDAGDFLLGEIPEPSSTSNTAPASQPRSETQFSISDAAFESQSPHRPQEITRADRVQYRKEAYKAAKDLSAVWETDHGLVSSFDGHGEEELEL
jgi:hypothetical protein